MAGTSEVFFSGMDGELWMFKGGDFGEVNQVIA